MVERKEEPYKLLFNIPERTFISAPGENVDGGGSKLSL
jgi:hypothetical protein